MLRFVSMRSSPLRGRRPHGYPVCHGHRLVIDIHHMKVHAGELILSGDAEGLVESRDASGQSLGSSVPSAAGAVTSHALAAVTRAGSSASDALDEPIDSFGMDLDCARVLAVMDKRGGWTVDSLAEATGLSVQVVLQTKCVLELHGLTSAFAG